MNAFSSFNQQLAASEQADFWASFEPQTIEGSLPGFVQRALSSGYGAIIACDRSQIWLRQELGINMGTGENRHEVGAVIVDYDWQALAWRVIGGAA